MNADKFFLGKSKTGHHGCGALFLCSLGDLHLPISDSLFEQLASEEYSNFLYCYKKVSVDHRCGGVSNAKKLRYFCLPEVWKGVASEIFCKFFDSQPPATDAQSIFSDRSRLLCILKRGFIYFHKENGIADLGQSKVMVELDESMFSTEDYSVKREEKKEETQEKQVEGSENLDCKHKEPSASSSSTSAATSTSASVAADSIMKKEEEQEQQQEAPMEDFASTQDAINTALSLLELPPVPPYPPVSVSVSSSSSDDSAVAPVSSISSAAPSQAEVAPAAPVPVPVSVSAPAQDPIEAPVAEEIKVQPKTKKRAPYRKNLDQVLSEAAWFTGDSTKHKYNTRTAGSKRSAYSISAGDSNPGKKKKQRRA